MATYTYNGQPVADAPILRATYVPGARLLASWEYYGAYLSVFNDGRKFGAGSVIAKDGMIDCGVIPAPGRYPINIGDAAGGNRGRYFTFEAVPPSTPIAEVLQPIAVAAALGDPVFVSCIDTLALADDQLPPLVAWDFGDPDGAYNTLEGFNAAHVYSRAGSFIATCSVAGQVIKSYAVTITAAALAPIYVSPRGDDNAAGTQAAPVQTLARAVKIVTKGGRGQILLERGGVYELAAEVRAAFHLDAYGTGVHPIIDYKGVAPSYGNPIVWQLQRGYTARNAAIRGNVAYVPNADDEEYKRQRTTTPIAFGSADNTAVIDCDALNCCYLVNLNNNPWRVLLQDTFADEYLRMYHAWVQGREITILGLEGQNSKYEHQVRISGGAIGVTVAFVNAGNEDHQSTDFRDTAKAVITTQFSAYTYGYRNTCRAVRGIGPLGGGDGTRAPAERVKFAVSSHEIGPQLEVWHGAVNVLVNAGNFDQVRLIPSEPGFPADRIISNASISNARPFTVPAGVSKVVTAVPA